MAISTTFAIFLLLLIPSLVLFFWPYKDKSFGGNDTPSPRFVGTAFATASLIACIATTASRMNFDKYCHQKIDLSELVYFKSSSKPSVADIYSRITADI